MLSKSFALSRQVSSDDLAVLKMPMTTVVCETETSPGSFIQLRGPFTRYERHLGSVGGSVAVETVEATVSIPGLAFVVAPLLRHYLSRTGSRGEFPSWHPPSTLTAHQLRALAGLLWLSLVVSYVSTLLGQTLTYSASDLHGSPLAQGVVLAVSRADFLIALPLAALSDKLGRRRVMVATASLSALVSLLSAGAFSMGSLAVAQVMAKGLATTASIVIIISVAELMPQGARAFALALLIVGSALGAGLCAAFVSVGGAFPQGWRFLYGISVLGAVLVFTVAHLVPETLHLPRPIVQSRYRGVRIDPRHRGRLVLISLAAVLINVYFIPLSQFRNDFLRINQHFSSSEISLFTIFASLPGGLGLALGGRLTETRGRKSVGTVGLIIGSLALSIAFLSSGVALWLTYIVGAIAGTASSPAIGIYGPELFPEAVRGRANAYATAAGRISSAVGVLFVGWAATRMGGYGPPIALLGIAPLVLGVLIYFAFPETKGERLEDISRLPMAPWSDGKELPRSPS